MKTRNLFILAIMIMAIVMVSCSKDPAVPTGKVFNALSGDESGGNNSGGGNSSGGDIVVAPTVITGVVSNITQTTAQVSGNVTNSGGTTVTERGVCWNTSHNPDISSESSHLAALTSGIGYYTVILTGLDVETSFYVRAYAVNSEGISYGEEVCFTTTSPTQPTLKTSSVTNITTTTATGGGDITDDGGAEITECGICWGISSNPDIGSGFSHLAASSPGTGSFVVSMTGLIADTKYYVRAYAINSEGTAYGNQVSFTTAEPPYPSWPNGVLPGLFSVNAYQQVQFSKGNLQYIGSASISYWNFAERQWNKLNISGQSNQNQNVDRDLFGWGTSGLDYGNIYYHPWDTDYSNSEYYGPSGAYDLTGTYIYADWGYNKIKNGGNAFGQWRTLTIEEWNYVLNVRQSSTVNGTANSRYAKAKVANTPGVILFPDSYMHPSEVPQPTGINDGSLGWEENTYSSSDWINMEVNGAVFLPAAGYRFGTSVHYDINGYGYYWSASCNNSNKACAVYFSNSVLNTQSIYTRPTGHSVRLVRSVQ